MNDSRARAEILSAVRGALTGPRSEAPPGAVRPERARRTGAARLAQFEEMVRFAQASHHAVAAWRDLPAAVAELAHRNDWGAALVLPGENLLRGLDWAGAGLHAQPRLARDGDTMALALADAGIAETGTLALRSGPHSPSTSNFLPEHHLVAVPASLVLAGYEDYFAHLRAAGEALPRTVNWITGPSRSGDIELRMLMGAHGPLSVHVFVVQGA